MTLKNELTNCEEVAVEKRAKEVRIEIAMKMKQNNEPIHKIIAYTGITKEEIIKLCLQNMPKKERELTDMEEYIIEKRTKEIALKMKNDGVDLQTISKVTGLTKEQIEKL